MESLAALGLAANVIQFIQFGARLISETSDVYHSIDGATEENAGIEWITEHVKELSANLAESLVNPNACKNERKLHEISRECTKTAAILLALLEELKIKGERKRWRSFKHAIKSLKYEKRIGSLRRRLDVLQGGLVLCLVNIMRDEQSSIQSGLDRILRQHETMRIDGTTKLTELKDNFVHKLENIRTDILSQSEHAITETKNALDALIAENENAENAQYVLKSLRYENIDTRFGAIEEAHQRTFEWIFQISAEPSPQETSFVSWLCSGQGIFWVSGRAGSGKSTLMKYLWNHSETVRLLQNWAESERLVTGSHFFWIAGTRMQKSQEGLLSSLLDKIFAQCPELIPTVVPLRWKQTRRKKLLDQTWTRSELFEAFERLRNQKLVSAKFCFFVDGLDEYDGDHAEIVRLLQSFTVSPMFKVCTSSRPWNVFEKMLGGIGHAQLKLEDLTRNDIQLYIHEKLVLDPRFLNFEEENEGSGKRLVEIIVNTAHGVFLWVILVVRDLLRGLSNDDTINILEQRLYSLPPTLEEYFARMLSGIDPVYRHETAQILLMALATNRPLSLMTLSFLDKTDMRYPIEEPLRSLPSAELSNICVKTRTRVKARTSDLMEVTLIEPDYFVMPQVIFLHRTVRDWLLTSDVQAVIQRQLRAPFDPKTYFCSASLAQLKMVCIESEDAPSAVGDMLGAFQENAVDVEKHGSTLDLDFLDEAERVWQHHRHTSLRGVRVFIAAIRDGLHRYVEKRLVENPALAHGDSHFSPLESVLFRSSNNGVLKQPIDLKMLRLLIRHGASPNQYLKGDTWGIVFLHLIRLRPHASEVSGQNLREAWFEALTILIAAGADINALVHDPRKGELTFASDYLSADDVQRLQKETLANRGVRGDKYLQWRGWLSACCCARKRKVERSSSETTPLLE